jgi:SAM-dependent methyltransferase
MNPFDILRSPDDGTRLGEDLTSEGGVRYRRTASGVLDLFPASHPGMPAVYRTDTFRKWRAILDERIRYYTTKRSVAGRLASVTYRRIKHFNRPEFKGRWLLDVGCGDGAQVALLEDRARYIGIDVNLRRLEILKERFPEVTAVYADAARLPLADGSVGGVFSSNAFEHIWHLKDCVLDLARCLEADGEMIVIIPTEGGLWNLGRRLLSRPRFRRRHPEIDFDFVSLVEHYNQASQVVRSLRMLFDLRVRGIPFRVPSTLVNVFLEIRARKAARAAELAKAA